MCVCGQGGVRIRSSCNCGCCSGIWLQLWVLQQRLVATVGAAAASGCNCGCCSGIWLQLWVLQQRLQRLVATAGAAAASGCNCGCCSSVWLQLWVLQQRLVIHQTGPCPGVFAPRDRTATGKGWLSFKPYSALVRVQRYACSLIMYKGHETFVYTRSMDG
eukprot:366224-Chlamydomonas_euryale.AAC.2